MRLAVLVIALVAAMTAYSDSEPATSGAQKAKTDIQVNLFYEAVEKGNLKMVGHYLLVGIPVEAKNSALGLASLYDFPKVVRALLAVGANPRIDIDGEKPILEAGHCGPEVLRLLIDAGANIEERSKYGETPLFISAANGKVGNVRFLLSMKANTNVIDKDGRAPLQCAAGGAGTEIVKLLIRSGANVNSVDYEGMTAFLWAASSCDCSSARALLAAGADSTVKEQYGKSALDIVQNRLNDAESMVRSLIKEPTGKGFDGQLHDSNLKSFRNDIPKLTRMKEFLLRVKIWAR